MSENNSTIIGTFSGICADAAITNENGLDITRPVWENVFNSETYKTAIELGHLIGYLGHPDDPNAMNFQDACIVMTEGHIEDDDKVYGTFNLVDTPVGRIVKTFIDAGVTFGISVRGAGDIINNSVDPETFVFRGFDLVTFPAYKEAIPEFTEIAASTDLDSRKKYQKICAAVKSELSNIESTSALTVLQTQFPEQSDMYAELEARKAEIQNPECSADLCELKLASMTKLYIELYSKYESIKSELADIQDRLFRATQNYESEKICMARQLKITQRIVAAQERDIDALEADYNHKVSKLNNKTKTVLAANRQLKIKLQDEKEINLQCNTEIKDSKKQLAEKDRICSSLQAKLDKTVAQVTSATADASNRDEEIRDLKVALEASSALISEYQDAYAALYARAVGANIENVSVTASTSVSELQKKIMGSSSWDSESFDLIQPQLADVEDDDTCDDDDLVTI